MLLRTGIACTTGKVFVKYLFVPRTSGGLPIHGIISSFPFLASSSFIFFLPLFFCLKYGNLPPPISHLSTAAVLYGLIKHLSRTSSLYPAISALLCATFRILPSRLIDRAHLN